MKYNSLQIKNVLWSLLILGLSATFGACSEDKTYEPLGEAAILTEVKLNVTDPLRLLVGTDSLISYSLSPDYATTKELVWTSDDEEIASVDAEGCITAHKVGETNIRVQSKVGYVAMAILKLQVISEIIKVTDIAVTPEMPEVFATANLQLQATVSPATATYPAVKWTSETPDIASVSENGVVTGIANGNEEATARIRVSATDGSKVTKVIEVKVKPIIPVEAIEFVGEEPELALKETTKLAYTITPANATVESLSWTSSDEAVVSVTNEGIVTTHAYGEAEITAATSDGTKAAKMKVSVVKGRINDYGEALLAYLPTRGGTTKMDDGKLVVTYKAATNREDLDRKGTYFNATKYPILAVKAGCEVMNSFWHNIDLVQGTKFYSYKDNKYKTFINTKDGNRICYVNLSIPGDDNTGGYFSEGEKYADRFIINSGENASKTVSYDIYWVKTFKSVEELEAYIASEETE